MNRKYWKYRTLVAGIDQYGRFLALGVILALGQDPGQVGDRIACLRAGRGQIRQSVLAEIERRNVD